MKVKELGIFQQSWAMVSRCIMFDEMPSLLKDEHQSIIPYQMPHDKSNMTADGWHLTQRLNKFLFNYIMWYIIVKILLKHAHTHSSLQKSSTIHTSSCSYTCFQLPTNHNGVVT